MNQVYLLTGSNQGNRKKNLAAALQLLEEQTGAVISKSALYETEAWGLKEQQAFLNQAICLRTELSPLHLLAGLKAIEKKVGRTATVKWGPRVIDIDILFYGNEITELPDLKIPHPYLQQRRFALVPLHEIAPALVHPVLHQSVASMLQNCTDNSAVHALV